jgi:SAM-dependent methyltransferase
MTEQFSGSYADTYDDVYGDKEYRAEIDLIEQLLSVYGREQSNSILDLGCGTGSHAIELARRGYEVVGVDRSSGMLAKARAKARDANTDGTAFHVGDIREVTLDREFDAVTIMFAVLGYQTENADVLATLRTARNHLRPGGILAFDVWYGPAVLSGRPEQRFKVFDSEGRRLFRLSSGRLDVRRQLCNVDVRLWILEGDRLVTEAHEQHRVRYFFPRELELYLEIAGLSLVRLGAFPDFDGEADESTWNVLVLARRPEEESAERSAAR